MNYSLVSVQKIFFHRDNGLGFLRKAERVIFFVLERENFRFRRIQKSFREPNENYCSRPAFKTFEVNHLASSSIM